MGYQHQLDKRLGIGEVCWRLFAILSGLGKHTYIFTPHSEHLCFSSRSIGPALSRFLVKDMALRLGRGLRRTFSASLQGSLARPSSRSVSSFIRGPTDVPLLEHTFPQFFERELLPQHSEKTALISIHEPAHVHGSTTQFRQTSSTAHLNWSFEELDRHVASLARGLVKLGVKRGDRVGVVMGNNRYDSPNLS